MQARIIKSSRGKDLLVYNKYTYSKQTALKNGEVYWRCSKKSASCYAKVFTVGPDHKIIRSELIHSHEPDVSKLNRQIIVSSCKRKAEELSEPPSDIIRCELENLPLPAKMNATDISYIKRNLNRYRQIRKTLTEVTEPLVDPLAYCELKYEKEIVDEVSKVGEYRLGNLLIEGKTKQVYDLPSQPGYCVLLSKDRITAGDGVKAHDLKGKAVISNKTTCKVFEILGSVGIPTAFVKMATETAFVSRKCDMIPIEWVTRRLATGSFLKRHPGVKEGYRFAPVKHETFFKDDANHDPQWSEEQIISAEFKVNGVLIGEKEVDYMTRVSILVFEVLEKVWQTRNCALIDMKIEFGVDNSGEILVADVIDSDSWRLWPSGDKRLMVDKQVYRNLVTVTDKDLDTVKRNFEWIADQLDHLLPPSDHLVVIIMGSPSDKDHCNKIRKYCEDLGLNVEIRVSSAHKTTEGTLKIVSHYESLGIKVVFVAVAGRSNGLGPVISGNTDFPVINCPPVTKDDVDRDIWSSLNVPSGLGCTTVVYPESAALAAAQSIALTNYIVWAKLRTKRLNNYKTIPKADEDVRNK